MVTHFGDYDTTETVDIPFNSFSSDDPSASATITNLAAGDIEIHKDGSTTQRSSDAGVTVSIDFAGVTGNHMIHIDLSDNTDAGFYAAGSRYCVRIEGTTVDGATINAWVGAFSIGCVLRPTTAGNKLDVTATGAAGVDWGNVENKTTANDLTGTNIKTDQKVDVNTIKTQTVTAGAAVTINPSVGAATIQPTNAQLEARTLPTADYVSTNGGTITTLDALDTAQDAQHGTTQMYLSTNLGANGANATEAGGTGDQFTGLPEVTPTAASKTGYALTAAERTAIVDEWETQAAADPTGFKVNVMEVNGTAQTAGDFLGVWTPTKAGYIDAAISSRSSHSAADVDTTLTSSHGAGAWTSAIVAAGPTAGEIADAVWDEAYADHVAAGTYGKAVGDGVTAWVTATIVGLADGSIVAATFGADAITAAAIADGAFVAANFAANSLNGKGDWNTTTPPTTGEIVTAMQAADTYLKVLYDDWLNGGRLDLILDELTTQGDTNEGKIDIVDALLDKFAPSIIGTTPLNDMGEAVETFEYGGVTATYTYEDAAGNRTSVVFT